VVVGTDGRQRFIPLARIPAICISVLKAHQP
jgi:hypothetical protein